MYKTVRGMRDYLGDRAKIKKLVEAVCRQTFIAYGFSPLETPALEELGLLTKKGASGEEVANEIYAFKDKGGRDVGMRFDFTVPLARVVAANPGLPLPFKRWQIGQVWRYDRPQKNRYREFTQADIDVVGVKGMLAEFELIAATARVFRELGLKFVIKVNNRKLLDSIANKTGIPDAKVADCFRAIDKLDKIGKEKVKEEMKGRGIETKILGVLEKNDLKKVEKLVGKDDEGLVGLNELLSLIKKQKLSKFVEVDLCLARGLDYYTSTVFEVKVMGEVNVSCGGGGRYDGLVGLYCGRDVEAVGISYGVDRIVDALEARKGEVEGGTKVYGFAIGGEKEKEAVVGAVQRIRACGIPAEMDLMGRNPSKNLNYANSNGIPFALIIGEKELKEGKALLKDMKSGKQKKVGLDKVGDCKLYS